ncbi:hypothetical protein [Streptomyces violascens]|uniref:Integral membrane protein n=1 Tax=Streptomyces violascens TaxID=67381 RepID=A0ABQ3QVE8_9ACTN|nr:hypothetical protein [Streptomyces violascens]GGU26827.1 hypothetical protein GCM10010289_55250 [Streptomyces violascens]GHI41262.1 hypothetical protein Sviol_56700 [Streptomyces violascens]
MRASRALTVALAVGAAVGLAAPTAVAGGPSTSGPTNVEVDPSVVHQGATLRITARGCQNGGRVSSNAFDEVHLSSGDINFATARIHDHTTPGEYQLAVKCRDNDRVATRSFRVLEGRGADGGLGGAAGPSDTEMAVGGALVGTAAIGGALFVARRRRQDVRV